MLKFLAGLFSSNKVTDTAVDIVNKIAGTGGMTAKEQADFLLAYQTSTKHQSPARRFIAISITLLYIFFALLYAGLHVAGLPAAQGILDFLKDSLANPFNIVLVFYFTIQMANGFKGK